MNRGAAVSVGGAVTVDNDTEGAPVYLPVVQIGPNQEEINDTVISHLPSGEDLYQRMGRLCRVVVPAPGEFSTAAYISDLSDWTLQERLTRLVDFQRFDPSEREWVSTAPPKWCVKAVMDRATYPGVPVLRGIVNFPVIRPDGAVLQTPGYDASSYLGYRPLTTYLPVPDKPTQEDVSRALYLLWELVSQFPFAGEADFSAWLAGVLTPFVRYAFDGGCPCFVVTANAPRTGKTKLVDLASLIATGEHVGVDSYEKDESELKKKIFGFAKNGQSLVLFDNVDCLFGNHILDAAFTATAWSDREFHTQDSPKFPLKWICWVTSNRFRSKADTYKRIQPIRLKTSLESPEKRTDLKDPNIEDTVRSRRVEYVQACLILLRAFFVGRESRPVHLPFWHTFPAWSQIVRKCLVFHGLRDPFETHEENTEDIDTTVSIKRQLVLGWAELLQAADVSACSARDAHRWLSEYLEHWQQNPREPLVCETLITALQDPQISPKSRGRLPEPADIGYILRTVQDGVFEGLRIVSRDKGRSGTLWGIEKVET